MPVSQRSGFAAALLLALSLAAFPAVAAKPAKAAKPAAKGSKSPVMLSGTDLRWVKSPGSPGVSMAPLWGEVARGPYRVMMKSESGKEHPLHAHTNDVRIVIVSGAFFLGKDGASARDYGPGSYLVVPAGMKHVSGCRAGADCVAFQEGDAAFDTIPVSEKAAEK